MPMKIALKRVIS